MLSDSEWAMLANQFRLSPREMQVTRGIFDGRKHAAIATELKMSRHTLNSHWRRIKAKLQIAGRIQVSRQHARAH